MSSEPTPIDISNMPDLVRVTEEIMATKKPRKLIRDRKTVAILMPVGTNPSTRKKRATTKVDSEAFRAVFGSWKDVDTKALLKHIYADRRRTNNRPPVKL